MAVSRGNGSIIDASERAKETLSSDGRATLNGYSTSTSAPDVIDVGGAVSDALDETLSSRRPCDNVRGAHSRDNMASSRRPIGLSSMLLSFQMASTSTTFARCEKSDIAMMCVRSLRV
jgi:hypothetical protein